MTDLTIGSLLFSGDVSSSTGFVFDSLTDWDSATASKSPVNERNQAGGAFNIGFDYRQSAAITFTGWYRGDTRADMIAAKRFMKGQLADGTPKTAALTDADGTTTRVVSIRNIQIDDNRNSPVFTFTINMVAPDPLLYGPAVSTTTGVPVSMGGLVFPLGSGAALIDFGSGGTSGRITISNPGTARVFPPFQVSGGLQSGFVVTDITTGQTIEFDRQIPLGSIVYVNQRTGRAYIDNPGSDVSGFFSQRNWFSLGSLETHTIQFQPQGAVTGTPQLEINVSPGYI